jgi:hypothetical protein
LRRLSEQDALARLQLGGRDLAVLIATARSDRDDFALLRLFLDVSGMMIPPFVLSSPSMLRMTTRSCNGRNFMERSLSVELCCRPGIMP